MNARAFTNTAVRVLHLRVSFRLLASGSFLLPFAFCLRITSSIYPGGVAQTTPDARNFPSLRFNNEEFLVRKALRAGQVPIRL
jgi:hypothetical protein